MTKAVDLDPLDRLAGMLDPARVPTHLERERGYLSAIDEPPSASTPASRLMRSWYYPRIYPSLRPIGFRLASATNLLGGQTEQEVAGDQLNLRKGAVVLDVGCGPGNFTGYFGATVGPSGLAIGLDASTTMLKQAVGTKSGPTIGYIHADAGSLPFSDASVDAVSCFAALYLVSDPRTVVSEMVRVLKPGGRMAVVATVHGVSSVSRRLTAMSGGVTGVRFFSRTEIRDWLSIAGATDIDVKISGLTQTVTATV